MTTRTLLARTIVDGTGSDAITDGFVQIENGTISAVGRREELGSRAAEASLANATSPMCSTRR
jgi:cytosine/adenosine deaminase-related metal-dependent hydrolase